MSHSAKHANQQGSKPPKEIFCYGCNKNKPSHSFSKTQLTKYMSNIANEYAPHGRTLKKHHTMCKACTPQQNSTLTCMLCTRTKPLEKFAKAQRKNAEKARCLQCMKKREEDDIDDSEPDTEDSDGSYNETWDDVL
ncbi:Stc1 domain-containing protein [Glomus cerebriforme]|uniref:Stc1 domain-containing protein n=1 Tax=Glomus cerebriforme TaxID=658196 RepID=A0A397TI14_9GLOM|nr:Stc1 domain-containing protein [Glomus cerebriforme]